jgi:hypothetical protein
MGSSHLSDDRLVEIALTETPSATEQQHLGSCGACEARRAGVAHTLDEVWQAGVEDSDAAFPADRLARQQLRILQRIESDVRSARVIAFPAAQAAEKSPSRVRPASRWIAAAAVAGLVVGLLAGRMGFDGRRAPALQQASARPASVTTPYRAVAAISDDELLGQIETAINGRGGASLLPLDELTPRAWEERER